MHIYRAGVIGAGTMGAEIAQLISSYGLPVVLKELDQNALDRGMAAIHWMYQRRVERGQISPEARDQALALVQPTLGYEAFEDVDIAIEAVPERMDLKKEVFRQLQACLPETAILASNTSALSISELAATTSRPHKVIGMHFFNPAHVMRLVEIIPGLDTAEQTVNDVVVFTESLHKIPVVVQECPGFLVNRLLTPYLNESVRCLEEGASTVGDIDAAVVAFGMPMGPFTLMDMIGIDGCHYVSSYLEAEYGPRMPLPALFGRLTEAGRLGSKAGKGFYDYEEGSAEPLEPVVDPVGKDPDTEFTVERVMFPLINEAVLALQEHIAGLNDIELAMISGTGMTYQGERMGPLAIADEIGLDAVLGGLEALQAKYGERFRPARLLRTKVRAGHMGKKTRRGFHQYA